MRRRRADRGRCDLPGLWTPGRRPRRIRETSASWPARVRHGRSAFAADGNASRCQRRAVRSLSPNRQRLPYHPLLAQPPNLRVRDQPVLPEGNGQSHTSPARAIQQSADLALADRPQ